MDKGVLLADDIEPRAEEILREAGVHVDRADDISPEDLLKTISDYNGLVVRSKTQVTEDLIERGHKLEIVGRSGIGTDNIKAMSSATERGIAVVNAPQASNNAVAERVISGMLSLYRMLSYADLTTHDGKWEKKNLLGREIAGKTIGIYGFGRIGSLVGTKAHALGMNVLYLDPYVSAQDLERLGYTTPVERVEDANELFSRADWVTIHMPGGIGPVISYDHVQKLAERSAPLNPKGLTNTARAEVIEKGSIERVMEAYPHFRFDVDVFDKELERALEEGVVRSPAQFGHRVLMTPHTGGQTVEGQENAARDIAENFLHYFRYGICNNIVNSDANGTAQRLPQKIDERFMPYLGLSERLANLARNFLASSPTHAEFTAYGDLAAISELMSRGVIKGAINSGTTIINAPLRGRKHGVEPIAREPHTSYENNLTVDLISEDDSISLRGTVESGVPSLLRVGPYRPTTAAGKNGYHDYNISIPLEGCMAFCEIEDAPGAWVAMGTIPYERGLNIVSGSQNARYDKKRALFAYALEGNDPEKIFDGLKDIALPDGKKLSVYRTAVVKF